MNSREAKLSTYVDVAPNDGNLLQNFMYLRIGGAGNLVLKGTQGGASAVTMAVSAGELVPFGEGYVMVATTATGIVGLA